MDFFNLTPEQLPASRLVDVLESKSYVVDLGPSSSPRGAELEARAQQWAAAAARALDLALDPVRGNQLPVVGRSEPREAARLTTPFKKIVGDMWREYVLERPGFDLLIEYFDPRCPHCKKMQPVLDTLAAAALEEGKLAPRGRLIMVQLDATANDPQDWDMPGGVPAIHLYPAQPAGSGNRTKADFIAYSGAADRLELLGFIEQHARHSPIWTTTAARAKPQPPAPEASLAAEL